MGKSWNIFENWKYDESQCGKCRNQEIIWVRQKRMNIALILAGGTGTRLGGDLPKQYIEVNGKPIIAYCLETFMACEAIDALQIVADEAFHGVIKDACCESYRMASSESLQTRVQSGVHDVQSNKRPSEADNDCAKWRGFSTPGKTRQLSIWNGLQDIRKYASPEDVVIIHDAARPLVSTRIISDCLTACIEHDGALTVLPVKDTVYYGAGGKIEKLLKRSHLMAGQAPEAFVLGKYIEANERLMPDEILKINGSTEPAVMAGMDIVCVDGEEKNFKITTPEDLERFQQICMRV